MLIRQLVKAAVAVPFGFGLTTMALAQPSPENASNDPEVEEVVDAAVLSPLRFESPRVGDQIARLGYQHEIHVAHFGYDSNGKRVDEGYRRFGVMGKLTAHAGITDRFTVFASVPVVFRNSASLDAGKFRKSSRYRRSYESFESVILPKMQEVGTCSGAAECRRLIASGESFKTPTTLTLGQGERLVVQSEVPLDSVIDSLAVYSNQLSSGKTGLGDLSLGFSTVVLTHSGEKVTDPATGTLDVAVQFPTGQYTSVPSGELPTGRGIYEGNIGFTLDYELNDSILVSWQHKGVVALSQGKRKLTSLVNNRKLSGSNPDGSQKEPASKTVSQKVTRTGMGHKGFVKGQFAPVDFLADLHSIHLSAFWRYDVDTTERIDGKAQTAGRPVIYTTGGGVFWDGLTMDLPLQVDLSLEKPVAGKNILLADSKYQLEFRWLLAP